MGFFLKDMSLKGKTALVTGATKGLGRGAAEDMAEACGNIIAIGRNQSELNSLGKRIKKLKVQYTSFNCDVNDYIKIKNFHKNFDTLLYDYFLDCCAFIHSFIHTCCALVFSNSCFKQFCQQIIKKGELVARLSADEGRTGKKLA